MQNVSKPIVQVVESFSEILPEKWDSLTDGTPLLSHAFFSALESSKSVGAGTGWTPYPLLVTQGNDLIGAMPLYVKSHSYGEYVFDWSWADAYEQAGGNYYPKLLSAIPFSPITSARLLAKSPATKLLIIEALEEVMNKNKLSSAHILFPDVADAQLLQSVGWHQRKGVQFRWENKDYQCFDDFLQTLSHNKRKKIRQERNKISKAGVSCQPIKGTAASAEDWNFFYECYCNTYTEHRSTPYLTREFFVEIGRNMPENLLLIIAEQDGKKVAATLNIYNQTTLYGRYWGALQFVSGLHFELCYYQAQQFCIEENITYFEGGAQGEHKLARGFEPRPTCSYHKITSPEFDAAIKSFVAREALGIAAYTDELESRAPFKQPVNKVT